MEGEGICHYASVIKTCQKVEKNEKKKTILTENEKHLVFSFPSLRNGKKKKPFRLGSTGARTQDLLRVKQT